MSSNFLSQWLTFNQAQLALGIKSALDIGQALAERQTAAAVDILHAQLGGAGATGGGEALRELAGVQSALVSGLDSHWRTTLDSTAERTRACLGDLRLAQSGDEVGGVLAMFMKDLGDRMRADAERAGELLGSAASANKVLLARMLDGLIGAQAGGDATAQQAT